MAPPRLAAGAAGEDAVPVRLLIHLAAGVVLGTGAGWVIGSAFPDAFIDAVHAGFHGGWLLGAIAHVILTRREAATRGRTRAEFVALGAVLAGGVGFVLGFYGPMVLWPDANQGPLLGIFVTGPIGLVAGALGGVLVHRARFRPVG